jgi:phosphatidylinositol-4,5-bisphosphate 3-kinase
MHQSHIRLRFGLILEAYCRGCGAYLLSIVRQVEALDKLAKLSDSVKMEREVIHRNTLCGMMYFSMF